MMVRCGSCRNQFDVPGPGRFPCPVCGSVNAVRAAPGNPTPGNVPTIPPPAPRPPDLPSPRITCTSCDFSFIVGQVAEALCPNCGSPVSTDLGELPPKQ